MCIGREAQQHRPDRLRQRSEALPGRRASTGPQIPAHAPARVATAVRAGSPPATSDPSTRACSRRREARGRTPAVPARRTIRSFRRARPCRGAAPDDRGGTLAARCRSGPCRQSPVSTATGSPPERSTPTMAPIPGVVNSLQIASSSASVPTRLTSWRFLIHCFFQPSASRSRSVGTASAASTSKP